MITAVLRRTETGDTGTFGHLDIDGHVFVTGELPDRKNIAGISSIPAGTYLCKWQFSPKFQRNVYHLQDVPGRTYVEIHPANLFGDKAKGFKCELNGCIAIGTDRGTIDGQAAIVSSRKAVAELEALMKGEDFELQIIDEYLEAGAPAAASVA